MGSEDIVPESVTELMDLFFTPEVQLILSTVESLAGYRLSESMRKSFLCYHKHITSKPEPPEIASLRPSDARKRDWYIMHVEGVLGHTQNALACVCYHRDRLLEIEGKVNDSLKDKDLPNILDSATLAVGNTNKWDFEYQAFILAVRRCLDYLARALSAYFKNQSHSFRTWPIDCLEKQNRNVVTEAMSQVHKYHAPKFDYVMSEGDRKTLRDRISHYEYVPVGVLNISRHGVVLVGGGDDLNIDHDSPVSISELINRRTNDLASCIDAFLDALVKASEQAR